MHDIWEAAFAHNQLMWGEAPTESAQRAAAWLEARGGGEILIPGIGYGRNAKPFLARGMGVTGVEISETAIEMARERMGLELTIHHGSVTDMPFDDRRYDAVFCYGLIYLLDEAARAKLLADCRRQLAPGGHMIFTLISKDAPMYGKGVALGEDWFEIQPGVQMYFYDEASARRAFAPYGLVELVAIDEPLLNGASFPFYIAYCSPDAAG